MYWTNILRKPNRNDEQNHTKHEVLVNIPERKNDLLEGKYIVEAAKGATVAVKVTDMLGEEVLVVKQV